MATWVAAVKGHGEVRVEAETRAKAERRLEEELQLEYPSDVAGLVEADEARPARRAR